MELQVAAPTNRNGSTLDATDHALITQLLRNSRTTNEELSKRVGLSRPAVVGRLRRLQELGVIRGYTVLPDWDQLGYPILAYVQVRTAGKCREGAVEIGRMHIDGLIVEECHRTTGEWCLLVKIRARSSSVVEAFLDEITNAVGVQATTTMLALSTL